MIPQKIKRSNIKKQGKSVKLRKKQSGGAPYDPMDLGCVNFTFAKYRETHAELESKELAALPAAEKLAALPATEKADKVVNAVIHKWDNSEYVDSKKGEEILEYDSLEKWNSGIFEGYGLYYNSKYLNMKKEIMMLKESEKKNMMLDVTKYETINEVKNKKIETRIEIPLNTPNDVEKAVEKSLHNDFYRLDPGVRGLYNRHEFYGKLWTGELKIYPSNVTYTFELSTPKDRPEIKWLESGKNAEFVYFNLDEHRGNFYIDDKDDKNIIQTIIINKDDPNPNEQLELTGDEESMNQLKILIDNEFKKPISEEITFEHQDILLTKKARGIGLKKNKLFTFYKDTDNKIKIKWVTNDIWRNQITKSVTIKKIEIEKRILLKDTKDKKLVLIGEEEIIDHLSTTIDILLIVCKRRTTQANQAWAGQQHGAPLTSTQPQYAWGGKKFRKNSKSKKRKNSKSKKNKKCKTHSKRKYRSRRKQSKM